MAFLGQQSVVGGANGLGVTTVVANELVDCRAAKQIAVTHPTREAHGLHRCGVERLDGPVVDHADAVLEPAEERVGLEERGCSRRRQERRVLQLAQHLVDIAGAERFVLVTVHELQVLDSELDVHDTAASELDIIGTGLFTGNLGFQAGPEPAHLRSEVGGRIRPEDHPRDELQDGLLQRPLTGHEAALRQGLALPPGRGAVFVVGAEGLEGADERALRPAGPQARVHLVQAPLVQQARRIGYEALREPGEPGVPVFALGPDGGASIDEDDVDVAAVPHFARAEPPEAEDGEAPLHGPVRLGQRLARQVQHRLDERVRHARELPADLLDRQAATDVEQPDAHELLGLVAPARVQGVVQVGGLAEERLQLRGHLGLLLLARAAALEHERVEQVRPPDDRAGQQRARREERHEQAQNGRRVHEHGVDARAVRQRARELPQVHERVVGRRRAGRLAKERPAQLAEARRVAHVAGARRALLHGPEHLEGAVRVAEAELREGADTLLVARALVEGHRQGGRLAVVLGGPILGAERQEAPVDGRDRRRRLLDLGEQRRAG
jgi:hypothetical protein